MTAFKAGDAVLSQGKWCDTYPGAGRVVTHVGKEWVLYEHLGHEYCLQRSEFEKRFEKVEPFFEVGKTYSRPRGWSIIFQKQDVVEEFEVVRVDTENREATSVGRKVAYGKLVLVDTGEHQYVTYKGSWDFRCWTEKR